jgi:hypothetical protein
MLLVSELKGSITALGMFSLVLVYIHRDIRLLGFYNSDFLSCIAVPPPGSVIGVSPSCLGP